MAALDVDELAEQASWFGYQECQYDRNEGVIAFERFIGNDRELVRVWWRTHTVGTYLNHPSQGKSQLFRRSVNGYAEMDAIFQNPRTHTGYGYHQVQEKRQEESYENAQVFCLAGCGRLCPNLAASVGHFESGRCPNCPGTDMARQTVLNFCQSNGANFLAKSALQYGVTEGPGYSAGGSNYACPGCTKVFGKLYDMLQHQKARRQCNTASKLSFLQLGY